MTEPAAAPPMTAQPLSDFEGLPVRQAGVEMPGAAGGLRDAMKVAPQEFHKGEKVWIAIEGTISKIRFDPVEKDNPAGDQKRIHVIDVEGATFVDAEIVGEQIARMNERIQRQKEQDQGIARLPTDDEVEALAEEHAEGAHASGLVAGCPECDNEAAAEAEEANEPIPITGRKTAEEDA